MSAETNEEIVRRYVAAHATDDGETMGTLRAPGWTADMPQSGERIRGHENDRAIMAHWPGGSPQASVGRVAGSEDRWVVTPAWTYQRVAGEGDLWWADALARYPDGSTWFAVILIELRDRKVARETWFFGPPLEAPAWRARWVERTDPEDRSHER
jgi:hypothetical protein